ncbi:hypothetical protein C8D77_111138 [Mesorhizobium loti]|uniref:Uncharacterized protein n=1 Tax=Rhizobium loti TaxID=381 RepID=A0A8E2WBB8_RHILI|nr:hypothetical protein [Mesorhizobium loti]PWJ88415.1 hypothetical protein C8D77_111138 [Mesorhizobium loti]
MFPSADSVALALVTACRLTGTNPMLTALGRASNLEARGRHLAFAALIEAFPEARKMGVARCCGYGKGMAAAPSNLGTFRKSSWWREDWIDEIVGALVADQYGEAAE